MLAGAMMCPLLLEKPMKLLFILFVILPIAEIMMLIEVGGRIGTLNTAVLVVLTAFIGSLMLRQQGMSTLFRARERIDSGALPLQEMMEGICLAVGGALLVTPGFITDFIGFVCLLPQSRRWLVKFVASKVMASPNFHVYGEHRSSGARSGQVIEGEFDRDHGSDESSK